MKQIVRNIFILLNREEKRRLRRLAISSVLISLLDILFLIALLYVLNFYTQGSPAAPSEYFSGAVFHGHPLLLISVFFLLFAVKNLFGFFVSGMEYNFVYDVASRISRDNLLQYLNGSYLDYVNVDSSVVNRKISQQPIEFSHYVLNGMQQVFNQAVLVMITVIAIIIFNPLLFPLLILILVPPILLVSFLMRRKLDSVRQHGKRTGEQAIQHLQEALSGFVESNVYMKNDFFINRYHRSQKQLNHYLATRLVIQSIPPRLIEVFAIFGLFALVLVNYFTAQKGPLGLVTIGALMVAAYKIIPGIVKMMNTVSQIKTYSYTTADLAAISHSLYVDNGIPLHAVAFENVFFSYPQENILNGFSLHAVKGDMVGITGLSGRGKTTAINLLLGFLTPDSGNIYMNGEPANAKARQGYWARIAYIKQESFFLNASLMENITLCEGNYDEEKLKRVVALTGIDKLMASFPHGLETPVTENGKNFSGGQRQRIIFARALYKDFDLLIMDEPFNELDEAAETEMLKELQRIRAEGKIILLISHHSPALSFCNKKILMDD